MKEMKMFGMLTAKFAAMVLVCGLAGGAWGTVTQVATQAELTDAISAATAGDTIQLTANVTLDATLSITKNLTLDLNGHVITATKTALNVSGAYDLTIKDSAGNGGITVTSSANYEGCVKADGGGKLTIEGGALTASTSTTGWLYAVYVKGGSSLEMTGGSVTVPAASKAKYNYGIHAEGSGNVIISGGTISVKGSGGNYAINRSGTGNVTMTGGSIASGVGYVSSFPYTYTPYAINNTGSGTAYISGGCISAESDSGWGVCGNIVSGNASISGGVFGDSAAQRPESSQFAAGYRFFANTDVETKDDYPYAAKEYVILWARGNGGVLATDATKNASGWYREKGAASSAPAATLFVRDGYEFAGWNTVADGTGTSYDAGASITMSDTINLYAQWYVPQVETSDPEARSGASETAATYDVDVTVDGTSAGSQAVTVSVAAADIADTTLSDVNVSNVVAQAVAAAGGSATAIDVKIQVVASTTSSGEGPITYEVHPEAVITVTKNATDTTSTIELSNDDLASNASFTFDLDVTALGVAAGSWVKVTHVSAGYPNEEGLYKAKAGGSGVVVTVTTTHFSTFTATPGDPEGADASLLPSVTNSVASANLFGALTVNAGTSTNAFIAVPFGAFGIGDAAITAADVVQAAALSAGDKMYVWNGTSGTSQKYEVYKVDADGTWVVEEHKVTVAVDGTVTEGSESPESLKVPTGTGVFIERKDTSKPIYVYGQVLTTAVAETTFEAGLTLVSAPSTKAMGEIDLNALAWSGVKDVTVTTTTSGKKIVTSYKNADFIYYRNAANKVIRFYHYNGKWGTVSGTWKDAEAVIPAGTAFWYMNHGSASVAW